MTHQRSPHDATRVTSIAAVAAHTLALASLLGTLAACGQVRPLPPPLGCTITAYKLLPTQHDPQRLANTANLEALVGTGAAPASFGEAVARRMQVRNRITRAPRREVLVLSGGSQHGAFGAGFFRGMKATGGIPDYDIVTGVSTGALQSTFVFLANRAEPSDRDHFPVYQNVDRGLGTPGTSNIDDLALAYAIGSESDIFDVGSLGYLGAALHGSIGNFRPLRSLIGAVITPETIKAVSDEEAIGRSLFVGVTNLDDGYGYAIDMTKLAADGVRNATVAATRECYIEALVASSSVPPGVPPVALKRTDAKDPDLYLDGGARFGVFFDQLGAIVAADKPADMTLIVNGFLYGESWADKQGKERPARWSAVSFGLRTVSLLQNQVYRLSIADAEQWAIDRGTLKMAFISNENLGEMAMDPQDWAYPVGGPSCSAAKQSDTRQSAPEEFYPRYMRCMIDYGDQRARHDRWNKVLP